LGTNEVPMRTNKIPTRAIDIPIRTNEIPVEWLMFPWELCFLPHLNALQDNKELLIYIQCTVVFSSKS
jgi:hypothetical protein